MSVKPNWLLYIVVAMLLLLGAGAGERVPRRVAAHEGRGDRALALAARDEIVAVGMESGRCLFFDLPLTNPVPENISPLSELALPGAVCSVALGNDFAVAALGDQGIALISMSVTTQPLIFSLSTPSPFVSAVAASGDLVAAGYGYDGFEIFRLNPDRTLTSLSFVALGDFARRVWLEGGRLYVAAMERGLWIYDLSDPTSPVQLNTILTPGGAALDMSALGGQIFLARGKTGWAWLDLVQADRPRELFADASEPAQAVIAFAGDRVAVAGADVRLFRLSNAGGNFSARMEARMDTGGALTQLTRLGDLIAGAGDAIAPAVFSVQPSESPRVIARADTPGRARRIVLNGTKALVADEQGGLRVFDISNPTTPVALSPFSDYRISDLLLEGSLAIASDPGGGVLAVETGGSGTPALVGRLWGHSGNATSVATAPGRMGVAGGLYGYLNYRRDAPGAFSFLGEASVDGERTTAVAEVGGDVALVVDEFTGLQAVDVSDPASPRLLGLAPFFRGSSLEIGGAMAYVACGEEGVRIVEVSDPSSPQLISTLQTLDARGIAILSGPSEGLLLVADGVGGLGLADVSDSANPRMLTRWRIGDGDTVEDVAVEGTIGVAALGGAGIAVLNLEPLSFPMTSASQRWLLYE